MTNSLSSLLPMWQYRTYDEYCVSRVKMGLGVAPMSHYTRMKKDKGVGRSDEV